VIPVHTLQALDVPIAPLREARVAVVESPRPVDFEECDECAAKPGTPTLCAECLWRRATHGLPLRPALRAVPKPPKPMRDAAYRECPGAFVDALVEALRGER
jgi:hypothetical protein